MKVIPDIILEPNDTDNKIDKPKSSHSCGDIRWSAVAPVDDGFVRNAPITNIPIGKYISGNKVRVRNIHSGISVEALIVGTCGRSQYRIKVPGKEFPVWASADPTNKQNDFVILSKITNG
jgi:hypothetical protein